MPNIFISDIKNGDKVDQVFLAVKSEGRATKTGSLYLMAQLGDRTGNIEARMWNATNASIDEFGKSEIVRVRGRVETYQNSYQLIIEKFASVDESAVDLSSLMPSTDKDVEKMMSELQDILYSVTNKHIKQLFKLFLEDDEICKGLRSAPAAVNYHHAFLGGLLEHIVSTLKLALSVLPNYPVIDKDLLLTGVFFHDIGKITELSYTKGFKYTDEGMLVGHLIVGVNMVIEKAGKIKGFPKKLLNVITHLLLSHHGEYEWGSPKLPMTVEAIALHYLDNFDAKVYAFGKAIKEDKNENSNWTEYNRMFARKLYKNNYYSEDD